MNILTIVLLSFLLESCDSIFGLGLKDRNIHNISETNIFLDIESAVIKKDIENIINIKNRNNLDWDTPIDINYDDSVKDKRSFTTLTSLLVKSNDSDIYKKFRSEIPVDKGIISFLHYCSEITESTKDEKKKELIYYLNLAIYLNFFGDDFINSLNKILEMDKYSLDYTKVMKKIVQSSKENSYFNFFKKAVSMYGIFTDNLTTSMVMHSKRSSEDVFEHVQYILKDIDAINIEQSIDKLSTDYSNKLKDNINDLYKQGFTILNVSSNNSNKDIEIEKKTAIREFKGRIKKTFFLKLMYPQNNQFFDSTKAFIEILEAIYFVER
jgi:hypothetical protein